MNNQIPPLFKNVPRLTFLSADLCPMKFARIFLNKHPNLVHGRSVTVNLERFVKMSLIRLVTMFQGNNVLKFLFKIVNQLQEKNVPLFQDKILLLLISSAVLYSKVTNNVPEQKFNDVQTDVVVTLPRPSCTKVSDKVHTSSTTKIHLHEGYMFVDRKKVRQMSLYWMTEADEKSTGERRSCLSNRLAEVWQMSLYWMSEADDWSTGESRGLFKIFNVSSRKAKWKLDKNRHIEETKRLWQQGVCCKIRSLNDENRDR